MNPLQRSNLNESEISYNIIHALLSTLLVKRTFVKINLKEKYTYIIKVYRHVIILEHSTKLYSDRGQNSYLAEVRQISDLKTRISRRVVGHPDNRQIVTNKQITRHT